MILPATQISKVMVQASAVEPAHFPESLEAW